MLKQASMWAFLCVLEWKWSPSTTIEYTSTPPPDLACNNYCTIQLKQLCKAYILQQFTHALDF